MGLGRAGGEDRGWAVINHVTLKGQKVVDPGNCINHSSVFNMGGRRVQLSAQSED